MISRKIILMLFLSTPIVSMALEPFSQKKDRYSLHCLLELPEGFVSRESESGTFFRLRNGKLETVRHSKDSFDERIFLEEDIIKIRESNYNDFYIYHYVLSTGQGNPSSEEKEENIDFVTAINRDCRIDFINMEYSEVKQILRQ